MSNKLSRSRAIRRPASSVRRSLPAGQYVTRAVIPSPPRYRRFRTHPAPVSSCSFLAEVCGTRGRAASSSSSSNIGPLPFPGELRPGGEIVALSPGHVSLQSEFLLLDIAEAGDTAMS